MDVQFTFDFDRALAVMVYIASKSVPGLTTYKMCKLVFLSDKLHLVRFGRPITGDAVCAMEYGPVPSAVYDTLLSLRDGVNDKLANQLGTYLSVDRRFSHPRFSMTQPLDFSYYLSWSEMNALEEVIAAHGAKGFDELYNLTHSMPSYKNAWDNPERTANNPLMSFEDFFTNDSEAIEGAKEDMLEDFEIRRALYAGV